MLEEIVKKMLREAAIKILANLETKSAAELITISVTRAMEIFLDNIIDSGQQTKIELGILHNTVERLLNEQRVILEGKYTHVRPILEELNK